ncbi:acyltransferase domain-containing protein [Nocardia sp. CDC159]|uniref:[acyl-carrier-protein] S-malonyltransferase n=1 Tax=Nocardia pulmonis TaxID=2951408 RepID=A0A9X2E9Q4_9NOCA|nr:MULTISPECIES: acyltransferase domain-containing protein [Nocardia]MCM6775458.1 acyltransferase domain-containing protein [Nocardia pulmonis]MCM6787808.1 acyltransferase domain-containing protein [Nocardia sp. CDC159]
MSTGDPLGDLETTVGLCPGQGAYFGGCLDDLRTDPGGAAAIAAVEDVTTRMLGRSLLATVTRQPAPTAEALLDEAPDMLQVAVFAASVAVFDSLARQGFRPTVLLGHSLGEIAALVCSGALDVTEGAQILCHRIMVLREQDTSGGRMLALSCARDRAEQIVGLLPASGITIAADNGSAQTTLSGSAEALRRVEQVADAVGVPATTLRSPHPFHSPLLHAARQALAERLGGYRLRGPHTPVFSPILGRYYRGTDDPGELLASHLVLPVQFGPAVDRLYRSGARIWIELGAGAVLTTLVRTRYPEIKALTPLTRSRTAITEAADYLRGDHEATPRSPSTSDRVERAETPSSNGSRPAPPGPAAPPPTPTPAAAAANGLTRADITARVRTLYAQTLEYPEEVFDDDAELEADLGIDSVKQTEMMRRVGDLFELGPPPDDLRVVDYRTFGNVVDFVGKSLASR